MGVQLSTYTAVQKFEDRMHLTKSKVSFAHLDLFNKKNVKKQYCEIWLKIKTPVFNLNIF